MAAPPQGDEAAVRANLAHCCRRNLEVLQARADGAGAGLFELFEPWLERLEHTELDIDEAGSVVRRRLLGAANWVDIAAARRLGERAVAQWRSAVGLGEQAAAARAGSGPKPMVIEGIDPPTVFGEIARATPAGADGYQPRLWLVQADAMELLDGLSMADLTDVLGQARVEVIVGMDAGARLASELGAPERLQTLLPSMVLVSPSEGGPRAMIRPGIDAIVGDAQQKQVKLHTELAAKASAAYAGRGRAWWAQRYSGAVKPLKVLIPTSRYSTFVRHSAADLGAAFESAGHEARVLMEPDDASQFATPAYLRQFAEWSPDLVVLINYPRRSLGGAIVENVPFVCWVQDCMPHLFDPANGASQRELDFVAGYVMPELFIRSGYPARNRMNAFVPASGRKFHDGPVAAGLREKYACDIAYISHQSEPAEAQHARMSAAMGNDPRVRAGLDRLFAALQRDAEAGTRGNPKMMAFEALKAAGVAEPPPPMVAAMATHYAVPMIERLHRHRTLVWAARIAERRGWKLAIFGNGWERHPELGRFARPALAHDEGLRAVYQSAGVCLHTSRNSNAHQRVYECALSGGMMLRRGPSPDASLVRFALERALVERAPAATFPDGSASYEITETEEPLLARAIALAHPEKAGATKLRETLPKERAAALRRSRCRVPLECVPDVAFERAGETLFEDEAGLEAMIERALADRSWRDATIAGQQEVVRRSCTYEAFVARLLTLVERGLKADGGNGEVWI